MRKLLQFLLRKPLTWMANALASSPKKEMVYRSLSKLYRRSATENNKHLKVIHTDLTTAKFIILSDQHKGNKSWADDFSSNEKNYIAALEYYNEQQYSFINLGDCEELWKFSAKEIIEANAKSLEAEKAFQPLRYFKTFGNHDLIWKNKIDVDLLLKDVFLLPLPVYEGIVLKNKNTEIPLNIFLTHGHQGDLMSDNNALSTWIVAHIWMPMQRYLRININTPSDDYSLRNKHNKMMYDWSSRRKNLILITGHTHRPVFASGKYYKGPSNKIPLEKPLHLVKPSYFNTGCCCYNDGDITGIEIADGFIRLVKWYNEEIKPERRVLEEIEISKLQKEIA